MSEAENTQSPVETADSESDPDDRSLTDALGEQSSKQYIKYNVGMFLTVGFGFGISLLLLDAFADSNGGGTEELLLFGILLTILFGPVVAAITGTVTGIQFEEDSTVAAAASALGAFAGFLALVLVLLVIASAIGGEADQASSEVTDDFLAIIGFGIGVAITGYGSTFLTKRFT